MRTNTVPTGMSEQSKREGLTMVLARICGIGALAGAIPGFLLTGIGGRIVMRIIAGFDPHTETEFTGDTMFLLIAGGLFGAVFGAVGGVLFMGVRRTLPGTWLWKGLAFGAIWLLTAGSAFFSMGQSEEFSEFQPPLLGVGLFALLFILFGVGVAGIVERLERYVAAPSRSRWNTFGGYAFLATISLAGLFLLTGAIGDILEGAG